MHKYIERIEAAVSNNESLAIACNCSVKYSGRAESFLPEGDRIVIIKSDNAIIVHQPTGNAPVNYMKPGSTIHPLLEDGCLVLRAQNLMLKDFMDIMISKVYFLGSYKLEDGASIVVTGTEKDMADMLYSNPGLIEKGFKPVSQEEQTKYGFIDVFGFDKHNVLTVVECKRYAADLKAVDQLRRYVEKIKQSKGVANVRGILASPKITPNAHKMLHDFGFSHIKVNPPNYLEKFGKKQRSLLHY
ncbi:MAG: endonuclease NucS [Candidatus Woesearchaeota archaeon]